MNTSAMGSLFRLAIGVIALPLFGAWLAGEPLSPYLTDPPIPEQLDRPEPVWSAFSVGVLLSLCVLFPFVYRFASCSVSRESPAASNRRRFPLWGWISMGTLIMSWALAWTRTSWFEPWQIHTFTPLWLSYIVTVNAWVYWRTDRCLLKHSPATFGALFPLSAGLWWLFEYLNRFTANWFYLIPEPMTPGTYAILASLAFSTVLPALYATHELLMSFQGAAAPFAAWHRVSIGSPRTMTQTMARTGGWCLRLAGAFGLVLLGARPEEAFPLLWLTPLAWLLGDQLAANQCTLADALARGDWRPFVMPALAGLVCGFWWECWNWGSLAHWEYRIPYVHAAPLFEMPILGYGGYLPFGMFCLGLIWWVFPGTQRSTRDEGSHRDGQRPRAGRARASYRCVQRLGVYDDGAFENTLASQEKYLICFSGMMVTSRGVSISKISMSSLIV